MKTEKIIKDIFEKETFLNNQKASYEDLMWIFSNLILKTEFLFKVINHKSKVLIYTADF